MRFIALLSGGKDSIYNLMLSKKDGHHLVAVVNLKTGEEKDSYMYQYVGNNVVPGIAEALEVPLETIVTQGMSYNRAMPYVATKDDEVEDLFIGLSALKQKYEFSGVAVGAIKSQYQYCRVADVCQRLGLVVLAYLWQREQKELLTEMVGAGLSSIVVKAGEEPLVGLVGQDISQVLVKYADFVAGQIDKYPSLKPEDFNMCGEGGEYETLTLDCPLFKQKIVPTATRLSVDSRGTTSFIIDEYKLVPKLG
ncbi:diphthine-ammonia ligase [Nematocida homosporus]|uniref:diphthine-ammonia ligase n=1 Tax=Nematocida homosporus TaxID=1912981 RepID=UPI00222052DC|nr:diphthine-ammonia ligase [Nematocida homosporus]KAI5187058.1 diphthine-ammonia ligase [Nematocida homosporus]